MEILKALNEELREFTAPVLVPNTVDFHGDKASVEEVRKACRNFNEYCMIPNIDHTLNISTDLTEFVESYVTPAPMMIKSKSGEEIVYPTGTWLATALVKSKELWEDVKAGVYTGLSVGCDALCQRIEKARLAGQSGTEHLRNLYDIDFRMDGAHIAFVGEAANATRIEIFKSTEKQDTNMDEKLELEMLRKEKADRDAAANQEVITKAQEATKQAEILVKAKEGVDKEVAALLKSKEDQDKVIEGLRKEKEDVVKATFIVKAKDMKPDDADAFGTLLYKCSKALTEDEYSSLEEQLGKLGNIQKNKEILDPAGEGSTRKSVIKSADLKMTEKASEFQKEDSKLTRTEALHKSREYFKTNEPDVYNEALFGSTNK